MLSSLHGHPAPNFKPFIEQDDISCILATSQHFHRNTHIAACKADASLIPSPMFTYYITGFFRARIIRLFD